jgi:hypothetical protein
MPDRTHVATTLAITCGISIILAEHIEDTAEGATATEVGALRLAATAAEYEHRASVTTEIARYRSTGVASGITYGTGEVVCCSTRRGFACGFVSQCCGLYDALH